MKLNIFSRFFKIDTSAKAVKNLPELIKKINKNEIEKYNNTIIDPFDHLKKDLLFMRFEKPEFDYIEEMRKEMTIKKKIYLNFKYFLGKYFNIKNKFINLQTRYEKVIMRPNIDLRKPHFGFPNENYKNSESRFANRTYSFFSVFTIFLGCLYLSFLCGYFYSKFKYDINTRKFMYVYYTSFILLFEWVDFNAMNILENLNYYFPKYISDKEAEYIAYRKMQIFFRKKKINKKVNEIMETDPDLLELDELLKKINK
jgi:hypothetical protein